MCRISGSGLPWPWAARILGEEKVGLAAARFSV